MLSGGKHLYVSEYLFSMRNRKNIDINNLFSIMFKRINDLQCSDYFKKIIKNMILPDDTKRLSAKNIKSYIEKHILDF